MPVEFRCPQCGKLLRTPDASAGKKGKCPHCQTVTDIPLTSTATPSPSPTPGSPAAPKTDLFANPPGAAPNPAPPTGLGVDLFGSSPPGSAPAPSAGPDLFANRPGSTPVPSAGTPDLFANVPSTPAPTSGPDLFSNLPGATSGGSGATDLFGGTGSAAPPQDKAQALFADPFGSGVGGGGYGGGGYGGGGDMGGGGYAAAPNPYGAPSYAASQPQYGYQAGQPHRAPLVLTLGIVALVGSLGGFLLTCCCAALFGPLAIVGLLVELLALAVGIPACVFGTIDLRKMKQAVMDPSGQGMTMTGFIMGIVAVVIAVMYLLLIIVLFAIVGVAIFSGQAMRPPNRF